MAVSLFPRSPSTVNLPTNSYPHILYSLLYIPALQKGDEFSCEVIL